ncbi:MAG: hypothetical protein JRI44_12905 [Deltaproteobacteria bacterium]|nr:hypothetical protein [Deltaproteobacteria bacterium]
MYNIGIQGIKGSSCEKAAEIFAKRNNLIPFKKLFLITTYNVFKALKEKRINYGTFAYSSKAGMVEETQKAINNFDFEKIDELKLEIEHAIFGISMHPEQFFKKIISHPQALKEHESYIKKKYQNARLIPAKDTSYAAKNLSEGKYEETTLVIAPIDVIKLFKNLYVIDKDLPTKKNSLTLFYLVKNKD